MAAKLSMSLRKMLTLTTFSQDDPASSKTSPRLEMHCAYAQINTCTAEAISNAHGMFSDTTVDDLPRFVGRDLTAQEDETWNLRGVG